MLVYVLLFAFNVQLAKAKTIVVPDDYGTVQQAIDFASPGDTVFVRKGTYRENLFIGKALTLMGENAEQTVIDGGGVGHVIYVKADFVRVSGFTLKNSSSEYPYSGLYLDESHNCQIYSNRIIAEYYGIRIYNSSDNHVYQNYISYETGVELAWSHNNTISNNYIFDSNNGIKLAESGNNIIKENTFNSTYGTFVDVTYNSDYNTFQNNKIIEPSSYHDYKAYVGFYIQQSIGNILIGNMIHARQYCIYLYGANNTFMIENDLDGYRYSLYLVWDTTYYITFFHNNILYYGSVTINYDCKGVWDDGYPSGGNYWVEQWSKADYYRGPNQDEPGSDGIVDKPYQIDTYNIDRYPFMNPYRPPKFEISCSPSSVNLYAPQSKSCSIVISSVNSFILPVNISGSWFGQAPNGVVFSLSKSTITPPPNGKDTCDLTLTASSTASIGSFTLRIFGQSESQTSYADITITILSASLDITPPEISEPRQNPSSNIVQPNETVTISVNVTDSESGVNQVILSYTTNNGSTWANLNMQLNATTNSYEAQIPQQLPGTVIKYKVIAYDNAGNIATKDNNGYCYQYHVIPETFKLVITTTTGGTTTPDLGIYTYPAGSEVNVTAFPNAGYSFDYWLFDGNVRTENPITVIMDANHTLHAVFTQITYQLSIISTAGGTTNPAPGIYTYVNGTQVVITAVPYNGFSFNYWFLDGVKTTQNPITIIMNANHMLEAYFIDDVPPEISEPWQDPPANNVQPLQNVTVWVNVTDYGTGIKNVTLWYSLDNGTSWAILNMTALPIPSDTWITYEATIDGYGNCTWVTYKIIAYDNAGNNATKDNNGYGYQYHVIPEYTSTPILILLMLTTLIATTLWKTKRKR
jgi:parallel beta-helix repeat protein